MSKILIEINDLKRYFNVGGKEPLKAVDGINLQVRKGETLGLVGESGCGKSTAGRTIIGLYEPTDGTVIYDGKDTSKFNKKEKKEFTKQVKMIFQ